MEGWQKENVVTVIAAACVVVGLYAMSGSFNSLWGFVLLLNLSTPK